MEMDFFPFIAPFSPQHRVVRMSLLARRFRATAVRAGPEVGVKLPMVEREEPTF